MCTFSYVLMCTIVLYMWACWSHWHSSSRSNQWLQYRPQRLTLPRVRRSLGLSTHLLFRSAYTRTTGVISIPNPTVCAMGVVETVGQRTIPSVMLANIFYDGGVIVETMITQNATLASLCCVSIAREGLASFVQQQRAITSQRQSQVGLWKVP